MSKHTILNDSTDILLLSLLWASNSALMVSSCCPPRSTDHASRCWCRATQKQLASADEQDGHLHHIIGGFHDATLGDVPHRAFETRSRRFRESSELRLLGSHIVILGKITHYCRLFSGFCFAFFSVSSSPDRPAIGLGNAEGRKSHLCSCQ